MHVNHVPPLHYLLFCTRDEHVHHNNRRTGVPPLDEIIISHQSALIFWRGFAGRVSALKKSRRIVPCEKHSPLTPALLAELESLGFHPSTKTPLDLLFANREARVFHATVRPHVTSSALPPDSFLRLSEHVLIVCPELCLIQISNALPIERLILMCSEFCGSYLPLSAGNQPSERPPLTTLPALRIYAAKALPPRAGLRFRRALRHAVDGAASPMEARVALMLALPHALGGYNLPEPVLNHPHHLSAEAFRLYPHSPCRLDIC